MGLDKEETSISGSERESSIKFSDRQSREDEAFVFLFAIENEKEQKPKEWKLNLEL